MTPTEINKQMLKALEGLVQLQQDTEMIYEDAYEAMFKSTGMKTWTAAYEAIKAAKEAENASR